MSTKFQTWRPKPRRRSRLIARIDATPLVAILFALYILFTPWPGHHGGKQVDIVGVNTGTPQPGALREDSLGIMVTRDGNVFVIGNNNTRGGKVLSSELPSILRSMIQPEVERRVYVSADARAKYADVQAALSAVRDAGISDVTFMVESSNKTR
jgi:biopolymer transport protein ExbD